MKNRPMTFFPPIIIDPGTFDSVMLDSVDCPKLRRVESVYCDHFGTKGNFLHYLNLSNT